MALLGLSRKTGQRYSTKQKRISDVQDYIQSRVYKFHLPKILEKFVYWLSSYDDETKFFKLNSLPDVQRQLWMDPIEWIQVISVRETTFVSQNAQYNSILTFKKPELDGSQSSMLQANEAHSATLETKFIIRIKKA